MEYIRQFSKLTKNDAIIAGGKGASLGEMTNAGIQVPEGFVILADAFEYFIKKTNLVVEIDSILHKVNHEEVHTVENASEEIKALIMQSEMPKEISDLIIQEHKKLGAKYVAVRSSATAEDSSAAAWAGQLDSYLNTIEKDLLNNVKQCWASLFTPRAIVYRFEKNLHKTKISVAVVVQKMINSEESGIAFSVHPVTQDYNQIIIEAGFGLGEAIVSGQITPDSYVIEKEPRRIIDKNIAEQTTGLFRKDNGGNEWKELGDRGKTQVLADKEILELSELILKIENHYGFPCDIEWAREKGKFYIVQSRPITTLTDKSIISCNINFNIGEYNEYTRLFQGSGMPYLVSDIFMDYYRNLDGLAVFANNMWTTYLPNESVRKTLKEGLELYSNSKKFNKYREEFESYKKECISTIQKIISKNIINKEDTQILLNLATKNFFYYSKTEFFYLDNAYELSIKDIETRNNLKDFDKIKNSGREHLNSIFFGDSSYLFRFLNKFGKQTNIDSKDLSMYSKSELLSLFEDKTVNKDTLEQRRLSYIMMSKEKELEIICGNESAEIANSFIDSSHKQKEILKGLVASRGKVSGKVKVIDFGYDKFHLFDKMIAEMEKGDILVAETTAPELMVACKKAGAILTNQGGQMSHAAIVSRELGIPCIVALGNVTEILKDGDVVEVDGNKGTVKILKRVDKNNYKIRWVKEGEVKIEEDKYLFLLNSLLLDPVISKVEKRTGISEGVVSFLDMQDKSNKIFVSQDDKRGQWGYDFFLDKKNFNDYLIEIDKVYTLAKKFRDKIDNIDLDKISLNQAREIFTKDVTNLLDAKILTYFTIHPYSWKIEETLQSELLKTVPEDKIGEVMGILMLQEEKEGIEQERHDWLKNIVLPSLDSKIDNKKLEENKAISLRLASL